MNVISIEAQSDASTWTAVVKLGGLIYRAGYVNSQLTVGLVPYRQRLRSPKWAEAAVRTWSQEQIAKLGAEWLEQHRQMYSTDR